MIAAALAASCAPAAPVLRGDVAIVSALPLFWGEGSPADIVQGADQRAAIVRALASRHTLVPIDQIDASALSAHRTLILAQPRLLSPEELVALDGWVRNGGRALIFADPMLAWPSALALGDRRRAPLVTLLDPLLDHWGLALDGPPGNVPAPQAIVVDGASGTGVGVGRWRSIGKSCRADSSARWVDCKIGKGRAMIVADADLLDLERHPDNLPLVESLLARIAS